MTQRGEARCRLSGGSPQSSGLADLPRPGLKRLQGCCGEQCVQSLALVAFSRYVSTTFSPQSRTIATSWGSIRPVFELPAHSEVILLMSAPSYLYFTTGFDIREGHRHGCYTETQDVHLLSGCAGTIVTPCQGHCTPLMPACPSICPNIHDHCQKCRLAVSIFRLVLQNSSSNSINASSHEGIKNLMLIQSVMNAHSESRIPFGHATQHFVWFWASCRCGAGDRALLTRRKCAWYALPLWRCCNDARMLPSAAVEPLSCPADREVNHAHCAG